MNSLNFVAARVSPQTTPAPSRSNSYGNALSLAGSVEGRRNSKGNALLEKEDPVEEVAEENATEDIYQEEEANEKTPLLEYTEPTVLEEKKPSGWYLTPKIIASSVINSLRWMVSTIMTPGVYLIACFYDEHGRFAPLYPIRRLWTKHPSGRDTSVESRALGNGNGKDLGRRDSLRTGKRIPFYGSSSSGLSSESESDRDMTASREGLPTTQSVRHVRSRPSMSSDEIAPARRSIRIKLNNEDSLRQRKQRKVQTATSQSNGSGGVATSDISPATLKSPTSAAASLLMTKYPRAPAPPRPLIPRRQPSYTLSDLGNGRLAQKTLILDLDETLIHSMAKGGRMSTGHMVEVKLNTLGVSGQAPGPQHPILYYVHKRPFCDEFLRRVSKLI
jgi:CTD nuclear envelope phosphatase 1